MAEAAKLKQLPKESEDSYAKKCATHFRDFSFECVMATKTLDAGIYDGFFDRKKAESYFLLEVYSQKAIENIFYKFILPLEVVRDSLPKGHPKFEQMNEALRAIRCAVYEEIKKLCLESYSQGTLTKEKFEMRLYTLVVTKGCELKRQREICKERNKIAFNLKIVIGAFIKAVGLVTVFPVPLVCSKSFNYRFFMTDTEAAVRRATDRIKKLSVASKTKVGFDKEFFKTHCDATVAKAMS